MAFLNRILFSVILYLSAWSGLTAQTFEKAKAAFRTSYTQENAGDYKSAVNTLKSVYEDTSYEINLRLGWLAYKSGNFTQSEGYYRKAVSLQPYGIEARLGLVYPLSSMGNWTQVIPIYEEILTIDPSNSIANYRFGVLLYGKTDYARADKLFSKVVNLYPFDYDSLLMLAWTKYRLGKILEAKSFFQKVLLYNPDDKSASEGLALLSK